MRQKSIGIFSSILLKHIFLVAVGCLSLCLPAWSQTLIYGIENEIKDYNISRSLDKNAFTLAELVTERLYWERPDGTQVPDLVTAALATKNGWRLTLRESTFANGKKLTCADVRANIDEARRSLRAVSARLREISATSCKGNELTLQTSGPAPQLLRRMGHLIHVYDLTTLASKNPTGSGPYQIIGRDGKDLVLRPNKYYRTEANYAEIRFRTLRDPWLRDLALFSGNVDFLLENFTRVRLDSYAQNAANFAAAPGSGPASAKLRLYRQPSTVLHYLALNPQKFAPGIRRALRTLIFKSRAVEDFWGRYAEPTQQIFAVGPAKATDQAPLPGKLVLEVTCAADETQLQFLKILAERLAAANVRLKVRALEYANFMRQLNTRNFDAYLFNVDINNPQNLAALLTAQNGRLGLADPEMDDIFASIARTPDPQVFERARQKLESRVAEGAYLIPLYRPYRSLVTGLRLHITQTADGFWRDILKGYK